MAAAHRLGVQSEACAALAQQWQVSSRQHFEMEQGIADSKARESCLKEELAKLRVLLKRAEDEANRREAGAYQRSVTEMQALYSADLENAKQSIDRLQVCAVLICLGNVGAQVAVSCTTHSIRGNQEGCQLSVITETATPWSCCNILNSKQARVELVVIGSACICI